MCGLETAGLRLPSLLYFMLILFFFCTSLFLRTPASFLFFFCGVTSVGTNLTSLLPLCEEAGAQDLVGINSSADFYLVQVAQAALSPQTRMSCGGNWQMKHKLKPWQEEPMDHQLFQCPLR